REFLDRHVKHLLDSGRCYKNPSSRWCSPPLIINKPRIGNFRMTVDVRGPNEMVEPSAWPMPILGVEFDRLRGSKYYFSLDSLQRFWQFGVALSSQEIYSILTEEGVITPPGCSWVEPIVSLTCSQPCKPCSRTFIITGYSYESTIC
ncbi:RNA-dependent DNA polymerase, partial [Phytophthora megakarya]